jgi:NhaP-type Na+/H+ or K+/H+ antiporter
MRRIWISFIHLLIFSQARASVCLEDKRLNGTSLHKATQHFAVPGDYFDGILESIHEENQRTGSTVIESLARAHDNDKHGDEIPEGEGEEEPKVGVLVGLCLLFALLIIVVQTRVLSMIPSPIATLFTGALFAVIVSSTSPMGAMNDHLMNLNTEYVIYGFTPALILGEIFKSDARMVRRTVLQFVFYGLVGAMINAISTSFLLREIFPKTWSFELILCIGALMATADASFASGMLKRAGVPERVIMLLDGESINDGPMFTVLLIAKELYARLHIKSADQTITIDALEGIAIGIRLVISGVTFGVVMGIGTLGLLKFTSSRFEERNTVLQILITVVAAFSTFLAAEVIFDMSGTLALITVARILAWRMWPLIISEKSMTNFWETIDFVAESLLYLIVGFYVGVEGYRVDLWYCLKLATYLWSLSLGVRFISIFLIWPILNRLGPALNWREIFLWGWTGLKSRVCLALIYEFSIHLLDQSGIAGTLMKSEIVFIVGVAFWMSSLINGGLSSFVALLLRLDKSGELEIKLKSIFFKYSLYSELKKDTSLAHHFHHLAHYTVDTGDAHNFIHGYTPKPSLLGINWNDIEREEIVASLRSFLLTILRSLYWEENTAHKTSIFAIQGLLSSVERASEDAVTKPLNDFYYLMLMMPSRETKTNHYRVINMLTTMAECHMTARELFEEDLLNPILSSVDPSDSAMVVALKSAWEQVRTESEKCEKYAKREISVRFTADEISMYYTLRNLEVHKIHKILEMYADRGMLTDKDLEDAHEALNEDLCDIKEEMRAIGEGRTEQDDQQTSRRPNSSTSGENTSHNDGLSDDDETRPLKN